MNLHTSIVGNADDSLFYVILSASEISHDRSEKVYILRKTALPGVDSPDETGRWHA